MKILNNMNLEEEFIPYELAVKLKELGFDEECFSYYTVFEKFSGDVSNGRRYNSDFKESGSYISAPLWQQAFDFFIYNYGLIPIIETNSYSYVFKIQEITQEYIEIAKDFSTYQEARLECLKKLIELCNKK